MLLLGSCLVAMTLLDPSIVFTIVTTLSTNQYTRSRAQFSIQIQISLVCLFSITQNVPIVVVSTMCYYTTIVQEGQLASKGLVCYQRVSLRIDFSCLIVTSSLSHGGVNGSVSMVATCKTHRRHVTSSCLPSITQAQIQCLIANKLLLLSTMAIVGSVCSYQVLYQLCPARGWCWLCLSLVCLSLVTIGSTMVCQ